MRLAFRTFHKQKLLRCDRWTVRTGRPSDSYYSRSMESRSARSAGTRTSPAPSGSSAAAPGNPGSSDSGPHTKMRADPGVRGDRPGPPDSGFRAQVRTRWSW